MAKYPFLLLRIFSSPHGEWVRRHIQSSLPLQSEVFPIPLPLSPVRSVGASKRARVRHSTRIRTHLDVCDMVDSLNHLYGCSLDGLSQVSPKLSTVHEKIHSHLFTRALQLRSSGRFISPAAASRELLGGGPPDCYSGDSQTTVEPYDPSRVSLPDDQLSPVSLAKLLDRERGSRSLLTTFLWMTTCGLSASRLAIVLSLILIVLLPKTLHSFGVFLLGYTSADCWASHDARGEG